MLNVYSKSRVYLFFYLLLPVCASHAQINAWNKLQDRKWESAYRLIQKTMRKDSANLEANYVLANWFFTPSNPDFQIDSAYRYTNKSIRLYDSLSARDKDRVLKFPIDSLILYRLKNGIDSAAFDRAKNENTEEGYFRYIKSFPTAKQLSNAIELRDEVSFLEALKVNTYLSFQSYLLRYPSSHRAEEAMERYEKLLFNEKTKSKKLNSYKSFLKEYPESPYADEAHQQVFEIATASGEPEDFFSYVNEYPSGKYGKRVNDILFHIYKERDEVIPAALLTDSLKRVIELDSRFWIPFLKSGEFGFMDQTGAELLPPQFQDIRDEYKCGPIVDDILSLPDGYFSRTGKKIASQAASLRSIGAGFLILEDQACKKLIHKSGWEVISDCYEEYIMVDDNFIAARRDEYYTLFTLAGRPLPVTGITKVEHAEGLILLTRSGKKVVNTIQQLTALADGEVFHDELVFDEVVAVDKNLVLVRNSGMEGILDSNLTYLVPLDLHTLTKTAFGLIENRNNRISVHGWSEELENKTYDNITIYRTWLILYESRKIHLYDIPSKKLVASDVDSVGFDQSLIFVKSNQVRKVYLSATHSIDLQADSKINFISSRDSVQFIFTENKKKRTVFSLDKGDQLFVTEFALEESLGSDYFIVSKGSKKGVLGRNGKLVVPVEMNAIVLTDKSHLSLLKDKKFGLFDLSSRKYFKPMYARNLIPIDKRNLVVYNDGLYGVIDFNTKPVTAFDFAEVQWWSDSVIWVKKDFQWRLINYYTQNVLVDRVKGFTWIKNNDEEKIVRIHRENYYGIITNKKGVMISPSFTEIINLGNTEHPFYFTEKYVEEAGIYIVVYFDHTGKMVRRHAYEEEEYDRILCENH